MSTEHIVIAPEKLRELVFQAAGAATAPLLEDNPEYVFPSERVAEAVNGVLLEFDSTLDVHRRELVPAAT